MSLSGKKKILILFIFATGRKIVTATFGELKYVKTSHREQPKKTQKLLQRAGEI